MQHAADLSNRQEALFRPECPVRIPRQFEQFSKCCSLGLRETQSHAGPLGVAVNFAVATRLAAVLDNVTDATGTTEGLVKVLQPQAVTSNPNATHRTQDRIDTGNSDQLIGMLNSL